jgi:hypothetical protein
MRAQFLSFSLKASACTRDSCRCERNESNARQYPVVHCDYILAPRTTWREAL